MLPKVVDLLRELGLYDEANPPSRLHEDSGLLLHRLEFLKTLGACTQPANR